MIAADLTVSSARLDAIDFSRPFMRSPLTVLTSIASSAVGDHVSNSILSFFLSKVSLLVQGQGDGGDYAYDFFAPFSWEVWLLLLVAYILTVLVLWVTSRISPWTSRLSLNDSAWIIFACFFAASSHRTQVQQ